MKKIILAFGAAAMLMCAASCSKSATGSADEANRGLGDSLSQALGYINGSDLNQSFKTVPEEQRHLYKKDDILRGFKEVIMTDSTQMGYLVGINFGMQLKQMMERYQASGIPMNPAVIYEAYSKAFMADTVSIEALRQAQEEMRTLNVKAQQLMMAQREKAMAEARAAASREIETNGEAGAKYVKEAMDKDPDIKVTPSGLAYKVIKEGTGAPVGKKGSAKVNYKGNLVDGTQFDAGNGVEFTPAQVVPGFGEGLAMMKKGSKMLLIIPGNLAYGDNGAPQAGIGPNSTLVFEVEAVDVTPGEE